MLYKTIFRYAIFALPLLVTSALPRWRQHQLELERHKLFGRYSAEQILNRSEAICGGLTPVSECLYLSANQIETYTKRGASARTWQVACTDDLGQSRVFLQWNSETGLLETASLEEPADNQSAGNLLAKQAVRLSASYMVTLGTAGLDTWRLVSTPENVQGLWKCEFRSSHSTSLMYVSAKTGRLIYYHVITPAPTA